MAIRLAQSKDSHQVHLPTSQYPMLQPTRSSSATFLLLTAVLVQDGQAFAPSSYLQHRFSPCRPIPAAATGEDVIKNAGDGALKSVEWFGSLVSRSASGDDQSDGENGKGDVGGTGGSVYNKLSTTIDADEKKETQVWAALANLEKDSKSTKWKFHGN